MGNATADQIAAANLTFLANKLTRKIQCNAPNGTAYGAGNTLVFQVPVLPGWLRKLRLEATLTQTITMGTGTATATASAPYSAFSEARLSYGGQQLARFPVYWTKIFSQIRHRAGQSLAYGGPVTNSDMASLFTSPAVAAGANAWTFVADIWCEENIRSMLGALPMGSSASPITLEVDCTPTQYSTSDPFVSPVLVTGNATAALAGTVICNAYYLYGQSPHDPSIQVPTPVSGQFVKRIRKSTNVSSTSDYAWDLLQEPYEHPYHLQAVVIPGQSTGKFCAFGSIAAAEFDLDPGTVLRKYDSTTGGINDLWYDVRDIYGQDFDTGVIPWNFIAGNDPANPNEADSVNVGKYNASQVGVTYTGTLASASNRIEAVECYVVPIPV